MYSEDEESMYGDDDGYTLYSRNEFEPSDNHFHGVMECSTFLYLDQLDAFLNDPTRERGPFTIELDPEDFLPGDEFPETPLEPVHPSPPRSHNETQDITLEFGHNEFQQQNRSYYSDGSFNPSDTVVELSGWLGSENMEILEDNCVIEIEDMEGPESPEGWVEQPPLNLFIQGLRLE